MILQVIIFSFAILSARFGYKKVLRLKAIQITQINQIPRLQAESTSIESGEKLPIKPETSNVIAIGNTQSIKHDHPTIDLVLKRWREGSKPGHRLHGDIQKLALAIEGGGMRGCVAAGATAAIHFLGLNDAIDVVYGSSAGAVSDGVNYYNSNQMIKTFIQLDGRCILRRSPILRRSDISWLAFHL